MNKRLIAKIALIAMMLGVLTLFTACSFSPSNIDLGLSQLLGGIRAVFDGLVSGVVTVVVGIFEGIWIFIQGLFNIIIGAVAWLVEWIVGLF